MSRTISRAKDFFRRNQGQAMPEYAVVLAVVSSGSAFILAGLGARVVQCYCRWLVTCPRGRNRVRRFALCASPDTGSEEPR
jgi:Flp pilus assembly pilin Flp